MTVQAANDTSPPTDLELMLYADDELDGDRLAAVEAWLAASLAARTKLAALRAVSSMVRERALDSTRADGIADSVMGLIAAEGRHNGVAGNAKSASTIGAESAAPARKVVALRHPANDRSRSVYLIAAGVVAAVDFGTRMGAVFYVPGETAASSTTTVVWLSDDSAGENQ